MNIFKRKQGRPAKVIEPKEEEYQDEGETENEDKDEEDIDERDLDEEEEKTSELKRLNSELRKLRHEDKPVQAKPSARIISGKIVGDGIYEFTLITNTNLGEIGEEFEI